MLRFRHTQWPGGPPSPLDDVGGQTSLWGCLTMQHIIYRAELSTHGGVCDVVQRLHNDVFHAHIEKREGSYHLSVQTARGEAFAPEIHAED